MSEFDFSTLNSTDFEDLVCDIINADLPKGSAIRYKTFKDGKDKGIDFVYSTEANQFEHVGQAKHYYRTGYVGLYNHLATTEVAKTRKLSPEMYILATSVDLSVKQTEDIRNLFTPYIKNLNDIYGKKNLNNLIEQHADVLHRHYKLWFSSTTILEKILNSNLIYRSADFVENELTKRMRLFVNTQSFDAARANLGKLNFIIITGEPGVGKTTIAEMLCYEYIKCDYEFLFINDDIKEAESFFRNDDSKQIVYYDDFLGSNNPEMNRAQGRETTLLNIINRVRRNNNKKLVFTTRIHILNTAADQSERLKRARVRSGELVLNLDEYNNSIRRMLLLNHIDEAEIGEEYKDVLRENNVFNFIVAHKGFTPRSVELIMLPESSAYLSVDKFRQHVMETFGDPIEIWSHAYRFQIGEAERLLLKTLLTFDDAVDISDLETAFYHRISKDERAKNLPSGNLFKTAIGVLNKGFITVKNERVNFSNTSLKDFLLRDIESNKIEIEIMMNSISFIQQYSSLSSGLARRFGLHLPDGIKRNMVEEYIKYVRRQHRDKDIIRLAFFAQQDFKSSRKDEYLVDMINNINDWQALYTDLNLSKDFSKFLESIKDNNTLQSALKERLIEIINELVKSESDLENAVSLLEKMAEIFQIDFEDFDKSNITLHLDQLFNDHIFEEAEWLRDFITDIGEAYDKIREVQNWNDRLGVIGLEYKPDMTELEQDWDEIARENEFRRLMEKDD